jgi:rhodanese-related sulfurtransferase
MTKSHSIAGILTTVSVISDLEAHNLIKNNGANPDFIIIDVSTPADERHLANAINLNYYSPDFLSKLVKLERTKEYLVYCQTGVRSTAVIKVMKGLRFNKLFNLSGGIRQWIDAGYPTLT